VVDIKVDGDTLEAMVLEKSSSRIYLNNKAKSQVDVIDREKRTLIASWPITLAKTNVAMAYDEANHRFALTYIDASSAAYRFLWSPMINRIWPQTLNKSLKSLFAVRETRYLSEAIGSNKLAELDLHLRGSRLRTPVLEVLGSDEFRLGIAERIARNSDSPPLKVLPDLVAGALARRDISEAIRLLENEKDRGVFSPNDRFLLTYLYCLNGSVDKAEALAATLAAANDEKKLTDAPAKRNPLPGTFQAWMLTGKHMGRFHSPVCEAGLHPLARTILAEAAPDAADTATRIVICTIPEARALLDHFDGLCATLTGLGDADAGVCATARDSIRRALVGTGR